MADKLRIAFVWDWDQDPLQLLTWEDGLYGALQELRKRGHEVEVYTLCKALNGSITRDGMPIRIFSHPEELEALITHLNANVVLHWADMTRPNAGVGRKLGIPQAVCFAGGNQFGAQWPNFDLFFVESEDYKHAYLKRGMETMTAFGTNTKHYDPEHQFVKGQKKIFDVCFPATFAAWKRHPLFAEATYGYRTACAGYMYDDHETECWEKVQESGSFVLPHLPAGGLRHLYGASRTCLITSANNGGSQRTVLEAMAMNVPVIVMQDSDKTSEYVHDARELGYSVGEVVPPEVPFIRRAIEDWKDRKCNAREYVLSKWSHQAYADQIEAGLNKLVGS